MGKLKTSEVHPAKTLSPEIIRSINLRAVHEGKKPSEIRIEDINASIADQREVSDKFNSFSSKHLDTTPPSDEHLNAQGSNNTTNYDSAEVSSLAKKLTGGAGSVREKADKIYSYIDQNIQYDLQPWDVSASDTLKSGRGMCMNKCNLAVAMLRSQGIASRFAVQTLSTERGAFKDTVPAQSHGKISTETEHVGFEVWDSDTSKWVSYWETGLDRELRDIRKSIGTHPKYSVVEEKGVYRTSTVEEIIDKRNKRKIDADIPLDNIKDSDREAAWEKNQAIRELPKKVELSGLLTQLGSIQDRGTILASEQNVPLNEVPVMNIAEQKDREWNPVEREMGVFKRTIVAGTFDRLHPGHKALIDRAFHVNNHPEGEVVIGVTSDEYLAEKKPDSGITPFSDRAGAVEEYIQEQFPGHKFKIKPFGDIKGTSTAFSNPNNDSVAVTIETLANAHNGNKKRTAVGLPQAPLFIVPFVKSQSGQRISSSDIREGNIDQDGNALTGQSIGTPQSDLERYNLDKLPLGEIELGDPESWIHLGLAYHQGGSADKAKECFENAAIMETSPEGYLVRSLPPGQKTTQPLEKLGYVAEQIPRDLPEDKMICVGDVVSGNALKAGYKPKVIVYDGVTKRDEDNVDDHTRRIQEHDATEIVIVNPPGFIHNKFPEILKEALDSPGQTKIRVIGEEDLLCLSAAKHAPNGSVILYGKPNAGVVVLNQGEALRRVAANRLDKTEFKPFE